MSGDGAAPPRVMVSASICYNTELFHVRGLRCTPSLAYCINDSIVNEEQDGK